MFWRDKEKMSEQIKCCMCGRAAEFYVEIGSPSYKEYLCKKCAQINEEIKRLK